MATKAELERENADLHLQIKSLNADRGVFHTELGKLALTHHFKPLLEFLNFSHEELNDLQDFEIMTTIEAPMFNPYKKEQIAPLVNKPALVRMGGKRYLSKILCEKMNQIDHSLYVEAFLGGGRIYFEKDPEFMAIINDVERRITNFNYVVQHFPEEFHALQIQLVKDENTFFDLYDQYHDPLYLQQLQEDLRRAKKCWEKFGDDESKWTMAIHASNFYFYSNMAFRGSLTARTMTYPENDPRTEKNRLRWRIFREVRWMKDRMRNTTVLCQDFERVITIALRYQNHRKLFYFDPPFLKTESYENGFAWGDYQRLKVCVDQIKPPDYFFLSLNDLPELRELFAEYRIEEVQTHYTTGGAGQRKDVTELLIMPPWKPKRKPTKLDKWIKEHEGLSRPEFIEAYNKKLRDENDH